MRKELIKDKSYPSTVIQLATPVGQANVIIVEGEDGEVLHVDMLIGKAGSDVAAFCNALSKMATFAIQGMGLDAVIAELSDIATDRVTIVNGVTCRSGPEAMAIALRQYRSLKGT